MYGLIVTIVMWIVGVIGVLVMKRIEPDNKIYPVWVLFIEIAFMLFVVFYEFF